MFAIEHIRVQRLHFLQIHTRFTRFYAGLCGFRRMCPDLRPSEWRPDLIAAPPSDARPDLIAAPTSEVGPDRIAAPNSVAGPDLIAAPTFRAEARPDRFPDLRSGGPTTSLPQPQERRPDQVTAATSNARSATWCCHDLPRAPDQATTTTSDVHGPTSVSHNL